MIFAWASWLLLTPVAFLVGWIMARRHLLRFQRRQLEAEERAFSREDLEEADALAPGSRPLAEYRFGRRATEQEIASAQLQVNAANSLGAIQQQQLANAHGQQSLTARQQREAFWQMARGNGKPPE